MNLLAHLHLSTGQPVAMAAGNLLADFMRRFGATDIDPEFAAGVRLHRAIDVFTDSHPLIRAARRLIAPPRNRLAGIIIDIALDHQLSRHWNAHAALPLTTFVRARLAEIQAYLAAHDTPLNWVIRRAIRDDWLLSYATLAGLDLTFERVASRAPVAAALRGATADIARHDAHFQQLFHAFYPALRAHTAQTHAARAV